MSAASFVSRSWGTPATSNWRRSSLKRRLCSNDNLRMLEEPNELRCVAWECIKTEVQPEDDIRLSSQPQRAHVSSAACYWPLFSHVSSVTTRGCRSHRNKRTLRSHNYVSVLAQETSLEVTGKHQPRSRQEISTTSRSVSRRSSAMRKCLASIIRSQAGPAAQSQHVPEAFRPRLGPLSRPDSTRSDCTGVMRKNAPCPPRYCGALAPELKRSMASKSSPREGSD